MQRYSFCDKPGVAIVEGYDDIDLGGWYYFHVCQEHLGQFENNPHHRIVPGDDEPARGACGRVIDNIYQVTIAMRNMGLAAL